MSSCGEVREEDKEEERVEEKEQESEESEGAMPILESEGRRRSPSPPSSPPRMSHDDTKVLKMKSPEELLANPMDILKNSPFLMPAQLLALNPQLMAAQLAQMQAAQIMLAKQQADGKEEESGRKRAGEEFAESFNLAKQARSSSPQPMDLSGSKSPDLNKESQFNPFSHMMQQMPAGLLSMMQMMQGRPPISSPSASPSPPSPRHAPSSPWQAQWASKHQDSKPEDVFKCVWCKESYGSLDQLTRHMKEAKHHSLPQYPGMGQHHRAPPPSSSPIRASAPLPSPPRKDMGRDILREQVPLPRKLVRGQDVWIGRADEQTRDILKCMGCGASFRSLDLLTKHMQETQHYKKVISQDQISSWRHPESQPSPKNHVNSVLTCKMCDKSCGSLKELSDHMRSCAHHNGDARPSPQSRPPPSAAQAAAAKERKKALPVKKLLELERARQEVAGTHNPISAKEIMESGKLPCERCEEKIPIDIFIPHIQQCVGRPRFLKTPSSEPGSPPVPARETKAEAREGAGAEGGSILGSLEQLVKGNLGHSGRPTGNPAVPQVSPLGKFSINNLFPSRETSSPDSPMDSKPSSPSSSRSGPTSMVPQPTLDRLLDSPVTALPATTAPANGDRKSPVSDRSPTASPAMEGDRAATEAAGEDGKKGGNALAALQMFCNDQKKNPKAGTAETKEGSEMSDPGAILAFSWACNQAVSADSAIKCPFCDTPFISKGAYRHHLSKMHFTKENLGSLSAPNVASMQASAGAGARSPSPSEAKEGETLQSKYQKYSQLAKQLSCYDGAAN